ncbi:hypothetical protein FACS1894137_04200 [Spirochaetia bacterium]|nr:hypothetical protein FACS1894137_04200 [Spirochaetia bacterium]
MSDIAVYNQQLPESPMELVPFIAVGQNAVNAARDLLKTGKLDAMQYKAVLAKGQQQGELVLEAELKLKDIIQALPKATPNPKKPKVENAPKGNFDKVTKAAAIAELGLTEKQARNITALTPEAVEQAKAAARENDDIPTRSLALQIAKQAAKQEKREAAIERITETQNGPLFAVGNETRVV